MYKRQDQTFDDKIVLVSKNFYNSFEHKGFVRFIIDKKTLEFDVKTLDYLDFKGFLSDIYESGNVENGYSLDIRDFYLSLIHI